MRGLALVLLVACGGDDGGSTVHDAALLDVFNPHTDGGVDANLDPMSTACDALPKAITLGTTSTSGQVGALVCLDNDSCRITTNTSDTGTAPCPTGSVAALFLASSTQNILRMPSGWKIISATRGTFGEDEISDLPTAMAVTAFIRRISDATQYEATFTFTGGSGLTLSKLRK